jgi:hypothetical protein
MVMMAKEGTKMTVTKIIQATTGGDGKGDNEEEEDDNMAPTAVAVTPYRTLRRGGSANSKVDLCIGIQRRQ